MDIGLTEVAVDEEDAAAGLGDGDREVDGEGGFAVAGRGAGDGNELVAEVWIPEEDLRADDAEFFGDEIARLLALNALELLDARDGAEQGGAEEGLDIARVAEALVEFIDEEGEEDAEEEATDQAAGLDLDALVVFELDLCPLLDFEGSGGILDHFDFDVLKILGHCFVAFGEVGRSAIQLLNLELDFTDFAGFLDEPSQLRVVRSKLLLGHRQGNVSFVSGLGNLQAKALLDTLLDHASDVVFLLLNVRFRLLDHPMRRQHRRMLFLHVRGFRLL